MKITFFIGSIHGGGAERVVCELASYLSRHNHSVEILTVSKTEKTYSVDSKVSVKSLDCNNKLRIKPLRVLRKMLSLFFYIKKSDTDIYVVFLPETIRALLFFRKIIHVPIVVSERCDPSAYPKSVLNYLRNSYEASDGIVFQTEQVKQFIADLIPNMPSYSVIPNAVNRIPNKLDLKKQDKNVIVSAGRFAKQKNFPLLINAFSLIADKYPEAILKIYGEGDLRGEYEALIKSLGLEGRVQLPGFAEDIYEELYKAGMFVLSSDFEGIPNALIEAMSVGLPCISTDCGGGGARLLIKDNCNGLLVPAGDSEKMAEAMDKILGDADFAESISSQAVKICDEYSTDVIYSKWNDFLNRILNEYNSK